MTLSLETKKNAMFWSFILRGKSYQDGILLLINYLTEENWKKTSVFKDTKTLKTHLNGIINSLYDNYLNKVLQASTFKEEFKEQFKEGKEHFDRLLEKYDNILSEHTNLENTFQELFKAQLCAVHLQERKSLETTVKMETLPSLDDTIKFSTVILREHPLPGSNCLYQELKKISSENPPRWFKSKQPWEQAFLVDNLKYLSKNSIPSSKRDEPGLANLSQHTLLVDGIKFTYNRHASQVSVDLLKDLTKAPVNERENVTNEINRLTCLNLASQIELSLDQQLAKKNDLEKLNEAIILTQSLVSPGKFANVKSRWRSDPSDNDTQIYKIKEQAVKLFQQALNDANNDANKEFLEKYGLKVVNGCIQHRGHSIEKVTLVSTNRPYNILRHLGVYQEQIKNNDYNTSLLLGSVARYLDKLLLTKDSKIGWPYEMTSCLKNIYEEELRQLIATLHRCEREGISNNDRKNLINRLINLKASYHLDKNNLRLFDSLQALLSTADGQGSFAINDKRHRQSLISALEVIVVNCIGGTSWIACKSGKDRTGGASAAIDAAVMFYAQYGRFPRYDDINKYRACYLHFFKMLLESNHHQKVASQNAPGAKGLCNPATFLPGDIALDTKRTQLESQVARLNKPKLRKAKREAFNPRILGKELDNMVDKAMKGTLGDSTVLADWQRNWDSYFIDGRSVKELRRLPSCKGEKDAFAAFKDEADLAVFIKENLLYKIEDQGLKNDYLKHILYSFHQRGFPHVFEYLVSKLEKKANDAGNGPAISYSQSAGSQINFSPLKNGIEIDAINTFDTKTTEMSQKKIKMSFKHRGYYYQTHSSISVLIRKDKSKSQLNANINQSSVDCADERLKPNLLKARTLFEALLAFFVELWKKFEYWVSGNKEKLNETGLANSNNSNQRTDTEQSNSVQPMKNSTANLSGDPEKSPLIGLPLEADTVRAQTLFFKRPANRQMFKKEQVTTNTHVREEQLNRVQRLNK